ncbi:hypothetical protein HDV05_001413 [Chytridiales sp. JEL 0842]|nr:hypothetical protein HDV05_001413 [Chytridiales sp. JEL 0842]
MTTDEHPSEAVKPSEPEVINWSDDEEEEGAPKKSELTGAPVQTMPIVAVAKEIPTTLMAAKPSEPEVINWSDDEEEEPKKSEPVAGAPGLKIPAAAMVSSKVLSTPAPIVKKHSLDEMPADTNSSGHQQPPSSTKFKVPESAAKKRKTSNKIPAPTIQTPDPIFDTPMSEYERERELRMRQNREQLMALGVFIAPPPAEKKPVDKKKKKKFPTEKKEIPPELLKTSRRLRGEEPEKIKYSKFKGYSLGNEDVDPDTTDTVQEEEEEEFKADPIVISTPFTIGSSKVTVWEVGKLVTDPKKADLYWSQRGCRYRHMYPVGFRATKFHFGKDWEMRIEESDLGPLFIVKALDGPEFSGYAPTSPWTDACIALFGPNSNVRCSGPTMFSFTDPFLIAVILGLDDHPDLSYYPFETSTVVSMQASLHQILRAARKGHRFGEKKRGRPKGNAWLPREWDMERVMLTIGAPKPPRLKMREVSAEVEQKGGEPMKPPSRRGAPPKNNVKEEDVDMDDAEDYVPESPKKGAARSKSVPPQASRMNSASKSKSRRHTMDANYGDDVADDEYIEDDYVDILSMRKTPPPDRTYAVERPRRSDSNVNYKIPPLSKLLKMAPPSSAKKAPPNLSSRSGSSKGAKAPKSPAPPAPEAPPAGDDDDDFEINCICDLPTVDFGGVMVACDKCDCWFHSECVGYSPPPPDSSKKKNSPPQQWFCPRCAKGNWKFLDVK